MKRQLHLLVIDPQNDFCDLPPAWLPQDAAPALPVPGAHADMLRVAQLIREGGGGLTQLYDQGILPRRYVGDQPAPRAEQPPEFDREQMTRDIARQGGFVPEVEGAARQAQQLMGFQPQQVEAERVGTQFTPERVRAERARTQFGVGDIAAGHDRRSVLTRTAAARA